MVYWQKKSYIWHVALHYLNHLWIPYSPGERDPGTPVRRIPTHTGGTGCITLPGFSGRQILNNKASDSITNLAFSLTRRGSRLVFSSASGSTGDVACRSRIGIGLFVFPLILCSELSGSGFRSSLMTGVSVASRSDENEASLHLRLLLFPQLPVDDLAGIGSARGHLPSHRVPISDIAVNAPHLSSSVSSWCET
jgi:hypothetical protein